jgi:hypothetical protein
MNLPTKLTITGLFLQGEFVRPVQVRLILPGPP